MKNKPLVIDSPSSKQKSIKIYGNLCGTKPKTKGQDFDDFFNETSNSSLLSSDVISKMEWFLSQNPDSLNTDSENYTVMEDFKIMVAKSKGDSFENLLPSRSQPSTKSRYFKRLRSLTNHDLYQIIRFLHKSGVENKTLMFRKSGGLQGIKDGENIILMDEEDERPVKKSESLKKSGSLQKSLSSKKTKSLKKDPSFNKMAMEEEKKEEMVDEEVEVMQEEKAPVKVEEGKSPTENKDPKEQEAYYEISDDNENQHQENEQMPEKAYSEKNESNEKVKDPIFENSNPLNACCKALSLLVNLQNTKLLPILITKEAQHSSNNNEKFTIIKDFSSNTRELIRGISLDVIKILVDLKSVFQKSLRVIILDLQKVSGNLDDLIEYYTDEENREKILWNQEEDLVLEDAKTGKENAMKLLIKYKGLQRVRNRIKFRGLKKNFEI